MATISSGHWSQRPSPCFGVTGPYNERLDMNVPQNRYFQLVLVWPRDPVMYAGYLEAVRPIVADYDGRLERQFRPDGFHAAGLERPETVNFVSYRDRAAFFQFREDERFRRIVGMRTAAIALASIEGVSVREETGGASAPADRLYVIEVARTADGGAAYRDYEAEAEPVMARYGYHVERVVRPESSTGLAFQPDLVKVAYFDAAGGMERLHADPAHARIEGELYARAVSESVWIVAHAVAP